MKKSKELKKLHLLKKQEFLNYWKDKISYLHDLAAWGDPVVKNVRVNNGMKIRVALDMIEDSLEKIVENLYK
jgi:hypothetical protein